MSSGSPRTSPLPHLTQLNFPRSHTDLPGSFPLEQGKRSWETLVQVLGCRRGPQRSSEREASLRAISALCGWEGMNPERDNNLRAITLTSVVSAVRATPEPPLQAAAPLSALQVHCSPLCPLLHKTALSPASLPFLSLAWGAKAQPLTLCGALRSPELTWN